MTRPAYLDTSLLTQQERAVMDELRIKCWELYHMDLAEYFAAVIDAENELPGLTEDSPIRWN